MNQNSQQKTVLYVPNNIRTGMEVVSGFGLKELAITSCLGGAAALIGFILYQWTKETYLPMLIVFITLAVSFFSLKKNDINQSVFGMITIALGYAKQQQKCQYEYVDPFSFVEDEEEGIGRK